MGLGVAGLKVFHLDDAPSTPYQGNNLNYLITWNYFSKMLYLCRPITKIFVL